MNSCHLTIAFWTHLQNKDPGKDSVCYFSLTPIYLFFFPLWTSILFGVHFVYQRYIWWPIAEINCYFIILILLNVCFSGLAFLRNFVCFTKNRFWACTLNDVSKKYMTTNALGINGYHDSSHSHAKDDLKLISTCYIGIWWWHTTLCYKLFN